MQPRTVRRRIADVEVFAVEEPEREIELPALAGQIEKLEQLDDRESLHESKALLVNGIGMPSAVYETRRWAP